MRKIITGTLLVLLGSTVEINAQSFFLERPVADDIEIHGGYLYAEPHIATPGRAHGGVDYRIAFDTVYAAADGEIDFLFYEEDESLHQSCGNYMFIKTEWENRDLYLLYCHLDEVFVEEYQDVEAGQPVGIAGETGFVTGPHLHFEVRVDVRSLSFAMHGKRRNPELWTALEGTGAIYGNVPGAGRDENGNPGPNNSTRVDISPDPKPRPPYTTYSWTLTYDFNDPYIGSEDEYQENYAIGEVVPGTYTITALNGDYVREVTVEAGQIVNADDDETHQPGTRPVATQLHSNFPNPFNPSTTISFTLGVAKRVQLDIYDIMGNRVRTLADGHFESGTHEIPFDAQGLASGVYVSHMVTPTRSFQKKMLYMK